LLDVFWKASGVVARGMRAPSVGGCHTVMLQGCMGAMSLAELYPAVDGVRSGGGAALHRQRRLDLLELVRACKGNGLGWRFAAPRRLQRDTRTKAETGVDGFGWADSCYTTEDVCSAQREVTSHLWPTCGFSLVTRDFFGGHIFRASEARLSPVSLWLLAACHYPCLPLQRRRVCRGSGWARKRSESREGPGGLMSRPLQRWVGRWLCGCCL
jgi:hypothetical protein